MQQLAACRLADCTSGLAQPLTRELIFHSGGSRSVAFQPPSPSTFAQLSQFVFHRPLIVPGSSHLLPPPSAPPAPSSPVDV